MDDFRLAIALLNLLEMHVKVLWMVRVLHVQLNVLKINCVSVSLPLTLSLCIKYLPKCQRKFCCVLDVLMLGGGVEINDG